MAPEYSCTRSINVSLLYLACGVMPASAVCFARGAIGGKIFLCLTACILCPVFIVSDRIRYPSTYNGQRSIGLQMES